MIDPEGVLEEFAAAAHAPRLARPYRWPLWRSERSPDAHREQLARARELALEARRRRVVAPAPALASCAVCGAACAEHLAAGCSFECRKNQPRPPCNP